MVQVPVLAIHGGAGTINREALSAEAEREYRGALQSILEKGRDALAAGASALDAVTLAVSMLEDCPLFNAGRGAVYTSAETHEMDDHGRQHAADRRAFVRARRQEPDPGGPCGHGAVSACPDDQRRRDGVPP